jgi:hypothetical protein
LRAEIRAVRDDRKDQAGHMGGPTAKMSSHDRLV